MSNYSIKVNFNFIDVNVDEEDVQNELKSFFKKLSEDTFEVVQVCDFIPEVKWNIIVLDFIPEYFHNEVYFKVRTTYKNMIESFYHTEGEITKITMSKDKILITVNVIPKETGQKERVRWNGIAWG